MDKNKALIEKLKEFKKEVSNHMPLEKLIFFGSTAMGKVDRHSDIDLIIVSKKFDKIRPIERGLNLYDYWHIDSPVDFLCYTPEEFKEAIKRIGLAAAAMKHGIII